LNWNRSQGLIPIAEEGRGGEKSPYCEDIDSPLDNLTLYITTPARSTRSLKSSLLYPRPPDKKPRIRKPSKA
jgi:hypothetical protein